MSTLSEPRRSTVKRLFALSGNECAFPGCDTRIVEEGKVVAEICHIRAKSERGPRYDPEQSAEERHGFDNLVLMCPTHHEIIDQNTTTYTVEELVKIKKNHEENVLEPCEATDNIVDQLILSVNVGHIQVHNEFQNNGQLANTIVNNHYTSTTTDTPNKCRISSRRLQANIKNIVEDLEKAQQDHRVYSLTLIPIPSDWEKRCDDISDHLNSDDMYTLMTFYERIIAFNHFLEQAQERQRQYNPKNVKFVMHAGINDIARSFHSHVNNVLELDLSSLMQRFSVLCE